MRDLPQHRHTGGGREDRASGREAAAGHGPCRPGRGHTPQAGPDSLVGGSMIPDVRAQPLVAALSDGGKQAQGPILPCLGGHRARNIRQRPVTAGGVQARLRLVFPQPRPSAGASPTAPRRGGRATGANALGGRANRLRPRAAPPERSRGGDRDDPGAPAPRGRRCRTGDMAYRSVAHR
jgi:hypothetical protein